MKKIISALLIAIMLIPLALPAEAQGFTDVAAGSWYEEYVAYVTGRGIFNGVSATSFAPGSSMTRGMFVTALGRYAKAPGSSASSQGVITKDEVNMRAQPNTSSAIVTVLDKDTVVTITGTSGEWYAVQYGSRSGYVRGDLLEPNVSVFSDVPRSMYYTPYVEWAYSKGIASGTSGTTFSPEINVTREQICSILYNYAASVNLRVAPKLDKQKFNDDSKIPSWSKDAVYCMQQAGIINGREDGSFGPSDSATRAEVAAIMTRFIECVSYKPEPIPGFAADGTYIFGTAVPETSAVADSYFDDAAFIGNSFVDGMKSFFSLSKAAYYGITGISASAMLTYSDFELEETFENEDEEIEHKKGTLAEALAEKEGRYKKVYLMFGTNELGSKDSHRAAFATAMNSIIDLVRASQPEAKIYIISVPPIAQARSEESASYNRDNAVAFNGALKQISLAKGAYYLDIFTLFANSDGFLPAEHCLSDGIHILRPQYELLKGYLKKHTL